MAADDGPKWAALYVLGAGYKKLNGAYKKGGIVEDAPRFKHPDQPIWAFTNGEDKMWVFSNKSRVVAGDDSQKFYYKNLNLNDGVIPQEGWKKLNSPGSTPNPKCLATTFGVKEKVEVFSKKAKKWVWAEIAGDAGGDRYSLSLLNDKGKKKGRKTITLPRQVIRGYEEGSEKKYRMKQFVEIKTKMGDWMPTMIVGFKKKKEKWFIVLPDGKASHIPEERIRNSALVRESLGESDEPEPPAAAPTAAPTEAAPAAEPVAAGAPAPSTAPGANDGAKDAQIAQLKARVAQLEAAQKGEPIPPGVDQDQLAKMIDLCENLTGMLKGLQQPQVSG